MKRAIYSSLQLWKNKKRRKPLLLTGARQTGKSWILRHFGRNEFKYTIIIDFEKDTHIARKVNETIQTHGLDVTEILKTVGFDGIEKHSDNTLVVFDEIQRSPRMFTALKYFKEDRPDVYIAASGSLMGLALKKNTRAPVGCVDIIEMFPMTFYEFLEAAGETEALDMIREQRWETYLTFREKLVGRLQQYIVVGGMPDPVAAFTEGESLEEVRRIQKNILSIYEDDFNTHSDSQEYTEKLRYAWHIACELAGEQNKDKIFYQKMPGKKAADFYAAVQWLEDCGMISRCYRTKNAGGILGANTDYSQADTFRAYPLDTGLRLAASNIPMDVFEKDGSHAFLGFVVEQYVYQQLFIEAKRRMIATPAYYVYSGNDGKLEIDFMIADGVNTVPVEVKSQRKFKNDSFTLFKRRYSPEKMLRISLRNFGCTPPVWSLPLPMAGSAYDYIAGKGGDPF